MSHLDRVLDALSDLPYMRASQAKFMGDLITNNRLWSILEIGFFKGKSSACFAAILEDAGQGHLTTIDRDSARRHKPNIFDTLAKVGLTHRVTPSFAERSYTWELGKLIRRSPHPVFDLCYFDGGHTWDATGFGFTLVDMLLRPGGWIVFDDLDWTVNRYLELHPNRDKEFRAYGTDERAAAGVRMVFETLVPHFGYLNASENRFGWGLAQKPGPGS
jgi:predicted O-methyltransferase YrrM